jgi:epoxyqueuosine reductase
MSPSNTKTTDWVQLRSHIGQWAAELGFQHLGISDTDLHQTEIYLQQWLDKGFHGDMHYMEKHGSKRVKPEQLVAGTLRVISVRMDYLPQEQTEMDALLRLPTAAYISRYALGRDYHKVIRNRLQRLADRIESEVGDFGYRVFTDSAPVMEKALAEKAGIGWIGKHTNLINKDAGSWFFLGEIYTDLPLPVDTAAEAHCGSCQACIDCCPTRAIVGPYQVDARRCISYLTIELETSIPEEFRPLIGNRIYGCDDCQLVCPWNRFAKISPEPDYLAREALLAPRLIELFSWTEQRFLSYFEGSAIRRIGHVRWLRNIAVALGNAPSDLETIKALQQHVESSSGMLREHVQWALARQMENKN